MCDLKYREDDIVSVVMPHPCQRGSSAGFEADEVNLAPHYLLLSAVQVATNFRTEV